MSRCSALQSRRCWVLGKRWRAVWQEVAAEKRDAVDHTRPRGSKEPSNLPTRRRTQEAASAYGWSLNVFLCIRNVAPRRDGNAPLRRL